MKNKNRNERVNLFLFFIILLLAGFFGFDALASEDIIINELMWMGSSVSTADEWIELKNLASDSIDFSLTPWSLYKNDSLMLVINNGILKGNSYFLISNNSKDHSFSDGKSVLNIDPDFINTSVSLSNSSVKYKLYNTPTSAGDLIDEVDDGSGEPLAGENTPLKKSMERNDILEAGNKKESWHTCFESVNLDDGVSDCATPKAENSKEPPPPPPLPPIVYSDQIIINEFLPAPSVSEEFIELYNPGEKEDLFGWILHDASKTGKYVFPADTFIESEDFLVVYKKDFKFALNNSGAESLTLLDPTEKEIFKITYNGSKADLSYNFDGASWCWSKFLTPGEENIFNNLPSVSSKKTNKIYVNVYADFSASGKDADKDSLKYTWDFGDGHKSYKAKTRHKYEKAGKYTATLKVSDGSEDVITTYDIEVIEFPKLKVKIIALSPNPSGKDTGSEYITLKNETKKKINLKGWSIATGWDKLINHPIREKFEIKSGKSKNLTNKFASITLNNTKSKIELRDPTGRVIAKVKYEKKDGAPDSAIYEKIKKKWRWTLAAAKETANIIPETVPTEVLENTEDINTESDMLDEETQANLGKSSIDPEWKKKKENKIILASTGSNLKITLPEPQGQVLGASAVHETENYYSFTSPTAPEKHWAVKIWEDFNSLINSLLLQF